MLNYCTAVLLLLPEECDTRIEASKKCREFFLYSTKHQMRSRNQKTVVSGAGRGIVTKNVARRAFSYEATKFKIAAEFRSAPKSFSTIDFTHD